MIMGWSYTIHRSTVVFLNGGYKAPRRALGSSSRGVFRSIKLRGGCSVAIEGHQSIIFFNAKGGGGRIMMRSRGRLEVYNEVKGALVQKWGIPLVYSIHIFTIHSILQYMYIFLHTV